MSIKKIGFQNFRVFKDMQEIELAPITVLTGKNNSGKSSIIKALMLLTENAKKNSLNKLDFHLGEKKHKLYSFENILNDVNKDFTFSFTVKSANFYGGSPEGPDDIYEIKYVFSKSELQKMSLTEIFENKKRHKIIDTGELKPIGYYDINWFYKKITNQSLSLPALIIEKNKYRSLQENLESFPMFLGQDFFESKLKKFPEKDVNSFIKEFHSNFFLNSYYSKGFDFFTILEGKKIKDISDQNRYSEILSVVGDIFIEDIYGKHKFKILSKNLKEIIELYIKNISEHINLDYSELHKTNFSRVYTREMLETPFSKVLNTYFDFNVNEKIAKEREKQKKLMKFLDDYFGLSISYERSKKERKEEIEEYAKKGYKIKILSRKDFYGRTWKEIPSHKIIDNDKKEVIFCELYKYKPSEFTKTEEILKYINYWIGKDGFDIGEKIVLKKEEYSTVVKIIKDGREINIADLGSGTNQVLALILKIISSDHPSKRLMLEEPEVNLHPNLQSKLADLIVDAYKIKGYGTDNVIINRKFIIETHSEYFIRRLQYLVAKKVIKPEDVAIYYFTNPNELKPGEKQVVRLNIREDGMMDEDFGSGFFDESSKLTIDLLKIQNFS